MKSGLAIAIRYGDRRRQFGAPGADEVRLLDYRTHQRKVLPRLASAYALDFALKYLVDRFVNRSEEDQRDIETLAAGLKAYTTWANIESLQVCREACGGQGYMSENRFDDLKADTDIFCTFEGDNTVLMQLVVKSLLSDYRRQFEDARPFTLLKYVAARAADAVREPHPLAARNTDQEHLRDTEFHVDAFRYREQRLLGSLARRLKHRLDQGMDSFFALVDVQDHVMAVANAHAERIVMEQFAAGVAGCEDPAVRIALSKLAALFALSRIEVDRGCFLEAGYLSSEKSLAIREQVNVLCAEIRPDAVGLADGFGIPVGMLGAPFAMP
jgi:acyl-CoA oxidase